MDWIVTLQQTDSDGYRGAFNISARRSIGVKAGVAIFRQGEAADALYYLVEGRVKTTFVSSNGKESVLSILESGQFFGDHGLRGHDIYLSTARAVSDSKVVSISTCAARQALEREAPFATAFVNFLLGQVDRLETDVLDHLYHPHEKRLARLLLLQSQLGSANRRAISPRIDQGTLAGMIGATRSQVSLLMNKLRQLGHIDYDVDQITVHPTLWAFVANGADTGWQFAEGTFPAMERAQLLP